MAEEVGPSGRVYAVDIEQSLLAYIAEQAEERGLPQIETILAPKDGLGLPDDSLDLIFLSNVFHHLPDPTEYFCRARPILRNGGRNAVVDFSDNGFFGHDTPAGEARTELDGAGDARAETDEFRERRGVQIFLIDSDVAAD